MEPMIAGHVQFAGGIDDRANEGPRLRPRPRVGQSEMQPALDPARPGADCRQRQAVVGQQLPRLVAL